MGNAVEVFQGIQDFRKFLESKADSIRAVVPSNLGITPEKIIKMAVIAATKTPQLLQCSKLSVMQAIMDSAELGLDFSGTLGEGWIIPYGKEAVFLVGYRGLVALAYRSGAVLDIEARVVYEGDEFVWELGLDPKLIHKPGPKHGTAEAEPVAFYAIAHLANGLKKFEVMTKEQVDSIKQRSAAAKSNSSPWHTDYTEMGRKTVVRRLMKWLPLSPDTKLAVAQATAQEDRVFGLPDIDMPTVQEIREGRHTFSSRKEEEPAPPQPTPEELARIEQKKAEAKRKLAESQKETEPAPPSPAKSNEEVSSEPEPDPGVNTQNTKPGAVEAPSTTPDDIDSELGF